MKDDYIDDCKVF